MSDDEIGPVTTGDVEHLRGVEAVLSSRRVKAFKAYLGYLHFPPDHPGYTSYYELADRFGLPVATKPDSQELCFAPSGDAGAFVRSTAPQLVHASGADKAAPQPRQNLRPAGLGRRQVGQGASACRERPHSPQKIASGGFSWLQVPPGGGVFRRTTGCVGSLM